MKRKKRLRKVDMSPLQSFKVSKEDNETNKKQKN